MAVMPIELCLEREETTVVGDIDAFIEYVENGKAKKDWYDRMAAREEERDAFLREHSQVWSHIIIKPTKGGSK
jgi:ATP-dependent helicase/DNAse subunit B